MLVLTLGIQNANAQLYINEFMASNDNAFPGPLGDYPDWIEIYNAGDNPVSLAGYYFSDDLADTSKWFQIPDTYPDSVTVPANGYILFYANKMQDVSVLCLKMKLSGNGEQIGVWDPDKNVVDTLTFGPQMADTSYGRYPDGSDTWYFMSEPTPGAPNVHTTGVNENISNITAIRNYPNPFTNSTNIEFSVKSSDQVNVSVYNISGVKVAVLANDIFNAGKHVVNFDADELPAGLYLVQIKTSEGNSVLKITKTK